MLDVRRLRLLRDLSVHGTVTAVAEARNLSGPAVSQQLAALEREAGVALMEKHGRVLRLTTAGLRLVDHADVILGAVAAADADMDALRHGKGDTVRIAAFPSAARALLPEVWRLLASDRRERPDLRIFELEPEQAVDSLRQHEVDIAVTHAYSLLPRATPAGCEQHRLADDPVLLVLDRATARRHGLAPGDRADLGAFAGESWLLPGAETSCHELTRRACGAAGFVPSPVVVATDFSVLTALAAVGAGVVLVPRMSLPTDAVSDRAGVSLHPLVRPVVRTISALTRLGEIGRPRLNEVLIALRSASAAPDVTDRSVDQYD